MSTEWIAVIASIITAGFSAFAVIYRMRKEEPKVEASAAESITNAATVVVEMQNRQIDNLMEKVDELDKKYTELSEEHERLRNYIKLFRAGVKKLVNQVEDLGIEPVWTLEELPPLDEIPIGSDLLDE